MVRRGKSRVRRDRGDSRVRIVYCDAWGYVLKLESGSVEEKSGGSMEEKSSGNVEEKSSRSVGEKK